MNGQPVSKCSFKCKLATAGIFSAGLVTALVLLMRSEEAMAKAPLGKSWPASQRVSMDDIDHSGFDGLLKKHVDVDGSVNYAAWKRSGADRRALQQYLAHLGRAGTKIRASREAQLAFWINAYNAVTIEGILQVYPTSSIRNHTARVVGYNIWNDLPLRVADAAYSLHDIENKILRPMREPRIHFAIVCASVGCPRLRNEAYTADYLQHQLDDNARDFFSRSNNFRVEAGGRTMFVSAILDWFADDFGNSQVERFTYLKPYLPESARQRATDRRTRIRYLDYDWNLNDQSRKPRTRSQR